MAKIICGPTSINGKEVIGKSIEDLREAFRKNGMAALEAKMEGITHPVPEKYIVKEGDFITFNLPANKKCSIIECEICKKRHCLDCGDCVNRTAVKRETINLENMTQYAVVSDEVAVTLAVYLAKPVDPFYGRRPKGLVITIHLFGKDESGTRMDECEWNPKGGGCYCDTTSEHSAKNLVEENGHGTEEMWKALEAWHASRMPAAKS